MFHNKVFAIVFVSILFFSSLLSAASLRLEGERAWLKAEDVLLSEVLQLFEQRGARVFIDPSFATHRISGNWKNVEISRLIAQLVSPHSYMLEWQQEKSNLGDFFRIS